ncbi:FG-GAP-like repeat-containing protein, partial [Roseibium sp. RKSG952]|uniref:FG-GAP-like repeat-containing protein n=1 Tax=Roseibium sp. RKSG952 TaxID=2529384 RepID=UPI0013C985EF
LDVYVNDVKVAGLDTVTLDEISAEDGTGVVIEGEEDGDHTGIAAAAGDFNGDGYTDFVISADGTDDEEGSVYLIYGEEGGLPDIDLSDVADGIGGFEITPETDGEDIAIGEHVAFGDFNGDGYEDLLIAGYGTDAYVVLGTGEPLDSVSLDDVATGEGGFKLSYEVDPDIVLGDVSVTTVDLDADGYDELVIGFDDENTEDETNGDVYVVEGSADVPDAIYYEDIENGDGGFAFTTDGEQIGRGWSLSSGDVNGDGFEDLVLGAQTASPDSDSDIETGGAYIFYGSESLPDVTEAINLTESADGETVTKIVGITDTYDGDGIGGSVAANGDVNGDGYDDILLPTQYTADGTAFVILGGEDLGAVIELENIVEGDGGYAIQFEDSSTKYYTGTVAMGDANGDGYDDLIITTYDLDDDDLDNQVYVVFGQEEVPSGLYFENVAEGVGGFTMSASDESDFGEYSLVSGFDLNNDGIEDIFAGAPYVEYDDAPGTGYIIYGSNDWEDFA